MISRRQATLVLAGGLSLLTSLAHAEAFPSKTVRFIVPAAAGGGADILARAMTNELQEMWGQSVIVENKTGGAGGIGTRAVIASPPDGHTLLLGATNAIMALVSHKAASYDVRKELAPVTLVAAPPYLLVVNPSVPATNTAELIAYAKKNPGKLAYGSSGTGAASHLSGALFAQMAGIDMLHVPYRGIGKVIPDLLAGRVQVLFAPALPVLPYVADGKLRVIGTTGEGRSSLFPKYPTIAETGLPGYSSLGSFGIFAPAGTPAPLVSKIATDVAKVLKMPVVSARLEKQGAEPAPNTPEQFTQHVNATVAKWIDLGRKTGIKVGY